MIKGPPQIMNSLRSSAVLFSGRTRILLLTSSDFGSLVKSPVIQQRAVFLLHFGSTGSRRRSLSSSNSSGSTTHVAHCDFDTQKQQLEEERLNLLLEAKYLTLKLYRTIVRSVRVIRHGNEHDELEFQAREKKRHDNIDAPSKDVRLSMLSMLPPVDRPDELHSRAKYYQQYARENFVQESDSLNSVVWDEQHVARYTHHLRKGEEHRKWLLADMKFVDPFVHNNAFDQDQVDDFWKRANDYIKRNKYFQMQATLSPEDFRLYADKQNEVRSDNGDREDEENDGWSTEDDDDDDSVSRGLPSWIKKPTRTH